MTPARKTHVTRLLHAVAGVGPAAIVAAVQSAPLDNALIRAGLVIAVSGELALTPAGRAFLERQAK